jgi:flagellar hook-associated protein 2
VASTSVDGLVSGLSTSTLIAQLMQVEAAPQNALKSKVTAGNKAVTAYQSVNTKMAAVVTAAKALSKPETWGALTTTVSSDAATATSQAGGTAGSVSFRVDRLATTHTVMYSSTVSSLTDEDEGPALVGDDFEVALAGGGTVTVTPDDHSLQAVVDAINGTEDAAYRAAAVRVAPGQYTLQLTALGSGADAAFGDPGEGLDLGDATVVTEGADARILVGTTSPYPITSATNTFADVLPGLTVNVNRAQAVGEAAVTVKIAPDTDSITAKVQSLVDTVNAALTDITSQTRQKNGSLAAGPLVADSALRKLSQDLLGAVSAGAGEDLGSLAQVGITLTRGGTLAFDAKQFRAALATDPEGTRAFFDSYEDVPHVKATAGFNPGWDVANGLARRLETVGLVATEGVTLPTDAATKVRKGVLQDLIQRRGDAVRGLTEQVEAWDRRLELRQTTLKKQFSALETALGKMQQQSNWLAGQIAGLAS